MGRKRASDGPSKNRVPIGKLFVIQGFYGSKNREERTAVQATSTLRATANHGSRLPGFRLPERQPA